MSENNTNTENQQSSNTETGTPERLSAVALTTAAAVAALNGSFQSSQPPSTTSTNNTANPVKTLSPSLLHSILDATTVSLKDASNSNTATGTAASNCRTANANTTVRNTFHRINTNHHHQQQQPQQLPYPFPRLVMPTVATNRSQTTNATNTKGGNAVTQGIFHKVPLRRGKWTNDEETYANAVIEAFEQGIIQNCDNGITLRLYLSRKLHCQPMRISKKYAGQSIGKQVYLSRMDNHTVQHIAFTNENLAKLEFQFHMSIIQEGFHCDFANNRQKLEMARKHHHHQHAQVTVQQQQMPQNGNTIGNSMPVHSHQLPFLTSMHQSGYMGQNRVNGNGLVHQEVRNGPLTHPHASNAAAAATSGNSMIFPNLVMATQASSLRKQEERAQERKDQSQSMAAMNQTTSSIQKTLFDAFQEAQKSHYLAKPDEKTEADSKNNVKFVQRSQSPPTKGEEQTKWLSETMSLVQSLVPACDSRYNEEETPPTPTYTSKSFDDLHRLLGENIPELTFNDDESKVGVRMRIPGQSKKIEGQATKAANRLVFKSRKPSNAKETEENTTTVTYHQRINLNNKEDSTSIKTSENNQDKRVFLSPSDEYAFLAQQSVLEASKHSAYCEEPLKRSATPIVVKNKRNKEPTNGTQPLLLLGKIGAALLSKKNVVLHSKSHEGMTNGGNQIQNPTVVSGSEPSSSEVNSRVDSSTSSGTDDNSDSASSEGKSFSSSKGKRRNVDDTAQEKLKKIKVEEEAPISMQ